MSWSTKVIMTCLLCYAFAKTNSGEWCDLTCLNIRIHLPTLVLNVIRSHGHGKGTPAYLLMGRGSKFKNKINVFFVFIVVCSL